ncbi:MAG: hypothetical protein P1V97_12710 [Planctomycetota bacterium]|nr:hypothetical protein [Planctomycetota bacterium]
MTRLKILSLSLSLLFGGCAVLTDHNANIEKPYSQFRVGQFEEASQGFKEDVDNELDGLCYMMDRAMVHYVAGESEKSIRLFENAKFRMGGYDDRAKISATDISQEAASFLVNEKTISYKGEDFERVLLPSFQARNYFLKGDVDGAAVEARRCLFQQDLVKEKYDKELETANKEAKKQQSQASVSTEGFLSTIQDKCKVDREYLDDPQSVYQLAYVNYLTAMMLEAQEDENNARVYYLKVYDILPNHPTIVTDMARIEAKLGNDEESAKYLEASGGTVPGPETGSIVILYDSGEAPLKIEQYVVFPTGGFGFQKFALPFYQGVPNPAAYVELEIGGQVVQSKAMTSIEQVAFRYFNDRMPLIVAKAIIRVIAKIVAQKVAEQGASSEGPLARLAVGLGASLILSLSEQADLRAWRTLPQNVQVGKVYLPEGNYPAKLRLMGKGGNVIDYVDYGAVLVPGSGPQRVPD